MNSTRFSLQSTFFMHRWRYGVLPFILGLLLVGLCLGLLWQPTTVRANHDDISKALSNKIGLKKSPGQIVNSFANLSLNHISSNVLAANEVPLSVYAGWNSSDADVTSTMAWGDMDGDGDLDLAAGDLETSKVYLNQNGMLETTAVWIVADGVESVAWGDVDGDGDLDLATGDGGPNKLYLNQNGMLQTTAAWLSNDSDFTESVAWGDVDGDGDLDLAVGNNGGSQ